MYDKYTVQLVRIEATNPTAANEKLCVSEQTHKNANSHHGDYSERDSIVSADR
jgi:hypothetical protein